jgi:hypothetical protein
MSLAILKGSNHKSFHFLSFFSQGMEADVGAFGGAEVEGAAIALMVRVVSALTAHDMVNGARKFDADLAWHAQTAGAAAFEARKCYGLTLL